MNFDINTLLNLMSVMNGQKSGNSPQGGMQNGNAGAQSAQGNAANNASNPMQGILSLLPLLAGGGLFGGGQNASGGQNAGGGNLMSMLPMIMGLMGKNNPSAPFAANAQPPTQDFSQPTQPIYPYETQGKQTNGQNAADSGKTETARELQGVKAQSLHFFNPFSRIEFAGTEVNYIMQKLKSRV